MKKIGILYGMEQSFPQAIFEFINNHKKEDVEPELIRVGAVRMNQTNSFNVILDRVSNEVPYFRSVLKMLALNGARVVNNPFWACADDSFFHAALASKIGIKVPRTVIIPSKEHPLGTSSDTMRNLIYPLNWAEIFEFVGFPAYIKPNAWNPTKSVYKVYNPQEFFAVYDLTGTTVMILQESIGYEDYYRCYVVGREQVRVMRYDPTKPQYLRYSPEPLAMDDTTCRELESICKGICSSLGFDFNVVEFAIRGGAPYAVDFLNPTPTLEKAHMHNNNFEWIVEKTSEFLISLALDEKLVQPDYNWSKFLKSPITGEDTQAPRA